ncbi:hypothetical protein FM042_06785 [Aliidiomarina halalkaliphila]|uniref:PEGA domain-containing protein n=1 Tax=Aliidiomarina halalkaliphila TaxID=2593535 RepID=A0A552X167_9GAMM|nr:hypothetical protein [Aliidiomarina halalkaliphila]TRW48686.1 hypothetical protein FM042_06785 [Aliidiomarina halalkaliphila]
MSNIDDSISRDKQERQAQFRKIGLGSVVVLIVLAFGYGAWGLWNAFAPTPGPTPVPVVEEPRERGSDDTDPEQRRLAQEALSATRSRLQRAERELQFAETKATTLTRLRSDLDEAVATYTLGFHAQANDQLERINNALDQAIADFESRYTQAYINAAEAFALGQIEQADRYNREALLLNPDHEDARALQARIDVYTDVQALLERAHVAKMENQLERQRDYLREITLLDPAHDDAAHRLREVEQELTEQAYLSALNQAIRALDAGELQQAQAAVQRANGIIPNRAETVSLRSRIQTAINARELQTIEQQLVAFAAADEWSTVAMVANNALQRHPGHPASQQALEKAQQIQQVRSRVSNYIARPERLNDLTVLANAQQTLKAGEVFANDSPRLAAELDTLHELIEEANQPIEVILSSDNRTFVRVLGVGNVGIHNEYTFSLKPGVYQFEGRREGYRSKIITVTVARDAAPVRVRLVCDERV